MAGTFSDSWRLTKTAFRLIAEDRALLVFPAVAGGAILGILALLVAGWFWIEQPHSALTAILALHGGGEYLVGIGFFLIGYFAMTFIGVYATAGLIGAATLKLNGRQPTARDGWKVARARWGKLLVWSLISATVGLLIQAIARRLGGIAGLLVGVAGGATWSVATYFMVPVLLYEEQGSWRGIVRSSRLFVSTFGRTIFSNLALGLIVAAGIIVAVLVVVAGVFEAILHSVGVGLVLIGVGLAIAVGVALIGATAEGILCAALYRYATTGQVEPSLLPPPYRTATPLASGAPPAASP